MKNFIKVTDVGNVGAEKSRFFKNCTSNLKRIVLKLIWTSWQKLKFMGMGTSLHLQILNKNKGLLQTGVADYKINSLQVGASTNGEVIRKIKAKTAYFVVA